MERHGKYTLLRVLLLVLSLAPFSYADDGANHQTRQSRPIQLGTSGGSIADFDFPFCCGGTLGALLQDANSNLHILSNNHVLARSNRAKDGEDVVHPGLIDVGCAQIQDDVVADLSAFVPISFSSNNKVDAAIAKARDGKVDGQGSIIDIGPLSPEILEPALNLSVKKSGRTTGLTTGTITGINATVNVSYPDKCGRSGGNTATFVNQIVIEPGTFSAGGDSGSAVVENASTNPRAVGLLFAGSSSHTIANRMSDVLTEIGNALSSPVAMVGGQPPATGSISGSVTDSNGSDIVGATVSVDTGQVATTDSNGQYTITGVPIGDREVTASAAGYVSATQLKNVSDGGTSIANFALEPTPTGTISGTVTDSTNNNSAISGATVSVDTGQSATTDSNGDYTITDVPTGDRSVTASADSYESQTKPANVTDGGTTKVDFALNPVASGSSAIVGCITYNTSGGRNNDRHLIITIKIIDDLGNPVANATVDISVTLDGSFYNSGSGSTNSTGQVSFQTNNAPNGTYITDVTNVQAAGLTFNGSEPANSFAKGTDSTPKSSGTSCGSSSTGALTRGAGPSLGAVRAAAAVKARHEASLFAASRRVVGVAVGFDRGEAVIDVYLASEDNTARAAIPSHVESVRVRTVVTGEFVAGGGWGPVPLLGDGASEQINACRQ